MVAKATDFGDVSFQLGRGAKRAQRCWRYMVGWIKLCLAYACTLLIASWARVAVGASGLAALSAGAEGRLALATTAGLTATQSSTPRPGATQPALLNAVAER